MTRTYELKERGKRQNETRQKIVEAAIRLHQKQGISATSMSDIAAEAGVGKVTVYRHFPDIEAMAGACSGLYFSRNPLPDPTLWSQIGDPIVRLRQGLSDTYAWFTVTKAMMASVYGEARGTPLMAPYHAHWQLLADVLCQGWPAPDGVTFDEVESGTRDDLLAAGIALALDFETWHNLTETQGLTNDQVTDLMVRLTCTCD